MVVLQFDAIEKISVIMSAVPKRGIYNVRIKTMDQVFPVYGSAGNIYSQ